MAMGGKLPGCTCREAYRDYRVFLSLISFFTYTVSFVRLQVIAFCLHLSSATSSTFVPKCVTTPVNSLQWAMTAVVLRLIPPGAGATPMIDPWRDRKHLIGVYGK